MAGFERHEHKVNGIPTVVLTAGAGDPVVFFHGAGTTTGFDFVLPLAERFRVVVPVHPGFGDSGDDPGIGSVHDYVLHYLDLFDELGLDTVRLVGHSMGGWIAASFALEHPRRVEKLALVSPAGLPVPEAPNADLAAIPPGEVFSYLTENLEIFAGKVPDPPDGDFIAARQREAASFAQVAPEGPKDPNLARWLHRVTMPTLVLWGGKDRILPVGQASAWAKLLPRVETRILADRGHLVLEETPEGLEMIAAFLA